MSNYLLAIDPGNLESGVVIMDTETFEPKYKAKIANENAEIVCRDAFVQEAVIEMVASYGMPVGETVFETCVAIGRFEQILEARGIPVRRIKRKDVKMNLCGRATAKDSNIAQALVDRFAPGERNHGKGTKKEPGFFYGFKADIWQAYALGVTYIDKGLVVNW